MSSAPSFFELFKKQIDQQLQTYLTEYTADTSLLGEAMRYSTVLGGKRIRPILVLATAECFGGNTDTALKSACAVELIHAYSLIHDDLPAMDDDRLRRGQATCHIAYDEATAILAGDALQALAFELLSQNDAQANDLKIAQISLLAKAAGARGMVLGQMVDLESVGTRPGLEQLEFMHKHKTGALIEASVLLGAYCGDHQPDDHDLAQLKRYASAIGLAFQVQDDILDVVSDTDTLGKTQGADEAMNKPTYPALLGLEGAKEKLMELQREAHAALAAIRGTEQHRPRVEKLSDICNYIVDRTQ